MQGTKLACVGGNKKTLVVWDVGLEVSSVVHTSLTSSIDEIIWSPDGSRLLASTNSLSIKLVNFLSFVILFDITVLL